MFGSKLTPKLEIHISLQEGVNQYAITLEPAEADQLYPSSEKAYYWDKS